MNFSCGVTFDPTLVLTQWILTLAIQGLIVQHKFEVTENFLFIKYNELPILSHCMQ